MRSNGLLVLATVALLIGGMRYAPAALQGQQTAVEQSSAAGKPIAVSNSTTSPLTPHEEAHADALTLLAEYLGFDSSEEGIERQLREAAIRLAGRCEGADCDQLRDRIKDLCRIDVSLQPTLKMPRTCGGASSNDAQDARTVRKLLEDPSFKSLDKSSYLIAQLHTLAERNHVRVDFLTITVPDAIDSNMRWEFDETIQAIQLAAGHASYALDRFYVPDWSASTKSEPASGRAHESFPTVVIFRDGHAEDSTEGTGNQSPGKETRLAVVQLVGETPTGGIHKTALLRALRLDFNWQLRHAGGARKFSLRLVTPFYSGSRGSLSLAIQSADQEFVANLTKALKAHASAGGTSVCTVLPAYRLVSGSATADDNKTSLVNALSRQNPRDCPKGPSRVTFFATVNPESHLARALRTFLTTSGLMDTPRRIAILHESNTTWGARAGESFKDNRDLAHQVEFVDIPFPLHISRQRDSDQRSQPATALDAAQHTLPLPLNDGIEATDQLPVVTPKTTLPSVDLTVDELLTQIRREHVQLAALFATDARDRLWLAQRIAAVAPDVMMFTTDADLLYTHPAYGSGLRGMIVATTYPLFPALQQVSQSSANRNERLQFRSTIAEGMFNAVTVQLAADGNTPRAIDYENPFDATGARPPVWVSVVGRSGLWPLAVQSPDLDIDVDLDSPVDAQRSVLSHRQDSNHAHGNDSSASALVNLVPPSLPFGTAAMLLLSGVVVLLLGYVAAQRDRPLALLAAFDLSRTCERRGYLAALFGLGLVTSFVGSVATVRLMSLDGVSSLSLKAFLSLSALALAGNVLALGHVLWPDTWRRVDPGAGNKSGSQRNQSAGNDTVGSANKINRVIAQTFVWLNRSFVAGLIAWSGTCVGIVATSIWQMDDATATLFFLRLVHPANGVSPVLALVPILLAMYLWTLLHLKRMGMPRRERVNERLAYVCKLLGVIGHPSSRSSTTSPGSIAAASIAAGAAVLILVGVPRSHEGAAFDRLYMAASALTFMLVAGSLARAMWLWEELAAVLKTLVWHPLAKAFKRLPDGLFTSRISTRAPQVVDLEPLVARFPQSRGRSTAVHVADTAAVPVLAATPTATQPESSNAVELGVLLSRQNLPLEDVKATAVEKTQAETEKLVEKTVHDVYAQDLEQNARVGWAQTSTWEDFLKRSCEEEAEKARPVWARSQPRSDETARSEEFVAIVVGLSVREILARLTNAALFSTVALFLLLASHTFFPFTPKQTLLGISWVAVLIAVVAAMSIFIKIDRSTPVSAITKTKAGELNWDATLLSRVMVFAILPIASLIAAQFPQFGDLLSRVITPIQHVVP